MKKYWKRQGYLSVKWCGNHEFCASVKIKIWHIQMYRRILKNTERLFRTDVLLFTGFFLKWDM